MTRHRARNRIGRRAGARGVRIGLVMEASSERGMGKPALLN